MDNRFTIREIVKLGIFIALTTVMTMIMIPAFSGHGYLNLGDMVIFLAAIMMGKRGGFIVGGIGSALADLVLGYSFYAPITLIIKGLEGFLAGAILETTIGKKFPLLAMITGAFIMAAGYYIAETFLYGAGPALVAVPGNLSQGVVGAVAAILLYTGIKKTKDNN